MRSETAHPQANIAWISEINAPKGGWLRRYSRIHRTNSHKANCAPLGKDIETEVIRVFKRWSGIPSDFPKVAADKSNASSALSETRVKHFGEVDLTRAAGREIPDPSAFLPEAKIRAPVTFHSFKSCSPSSGDNPELLYSNSDAPLSTRPATLSSWLYEQPIIQIR